MNHDSRLSAVLHALLHLAAHDGPMTSEALALCMGAHPVAVRRTLAGLREAGLVASVKGHGGGWSVARDLDTVTLRDVYEALGEPGLFAIGNRNPGSPCLVEQAVNAAVGDALDEARALVLDRFASVRLSTLAADFNRRFAAHPHRRTPHGT
jgi:DNA-binding IscR family transcriptional regulator